MKTVSWVGVCIAMSITNHAFGQSQSKLEWFRVVSETSSQIDTLSMRCKSEPHNTAIRCVTHVLTVHHYKWKDGDADKEINRCAIASSATAEEVYQLKIPGVWQRVESGGLCMAFIEQTITLKADDVAYEEKVLRNRDNNQICLEAHGPTGTFKSYRTLRYGENFKFPCSSLNVAP